MEAFVLDGGARLPLPGGIVNGTQGEVLYGVRPEHFELHPTGFEAVVDVVEPTGAETHVIAHVGEQSITAVFRERIDARPGNAIRLSVSGGRALLFDAGTQRRLE
jgi:multiple sugar transport system ATP-binding protein